MLLTLHKYEPSTSTTPKYPTQFDGAESRQNKYLFYYKVRNMIKNKGTIYPRNLIFQTWFA